MIRFLEKYVMPVAGKVAEQRHLQAIRDGIILTMPFLIIGSFFLIISALPIPGYNEFMAGLFGENWQRALGYPVSATFNIMALIAVFGIAYRLGEYYKVDALASGALSLVTFLLATPFQVAYIIPSTKESVLVEGAIPAALMGSQGLFVAMIIALISTELYRFIVQKKDNYKDARDSSTSCHAFICSTCSRIYCCNSYLDFTLNYRKYFFWQYP